MAHILITGASGSIGKFLLPVLQGRGHDVSVIGRSRHPELAVPNFTWDLDKGTMDETALDGVTHIIHLAGAGIADKPWSPSRKQEIINSRVRPLQMLLGVLQQRGQRMEAVISASAVGYYGGITSNKVFTEGDDPATDFLGTTCKHWEDAVQRFRPVAERTLSIRTGIVLMREGGALPKLAGPVRYGFGVPIGSGKQWMPWIHVHDLARIYAKAVEDVNMNGPFNAVAPEQVDQNTMIKQIGRTLGRPVFLPPVPAFLVRTVLGEMATVLTEGSRVSSRKLQQSGFEFSHPDLKGALNDLLS